MSTRRRQVAERRSLHCAALVEPFLERQADCVLLHPFAASIFENAEEPEEFFGVESVEWVLGLILIHGT